MGTQHSTRLLSTAEISQRLGVSPETVRRWVHAGDLSALRLGPRRLAVEETELHRFVEAARLRNAAQ